MAKAKTTDVPVSVPFRPKQKVWASLPFVDGFHATQAWVKYVFIVLSVHGITRKYRLLVKDGDGYVEYDGIREEELFLTEDDCNKHTIYGKGERNNTSSGIPLGHSGRDDSDTQPYRQGSQGLRGETE